MKRIGHPTSRHGKHRKVECPQCKVKMRSDSLNRHLLSHNPSKTCKFCKKSIREDKLLRHELLCQSKVDETLCHRSGVEQIETAEQCSVSGNFKSFPLQVEKSMDYDQVIADTCSAAKDRLVQLLETHPVKVQVVIGLSFYKMAGGEKDLSEKVFRSICEPLVMADDLDAFFGRVKVYIKARIEEYERYGSGWIFEELKCSHLQVAKYTPLSGSGKVNIPRKVKKMRSVLNISSPDNKCFLYCLLAKLPEKKLPEETVKESQGLHAAFAENNAPLK